MYARRQGACVDGDDAMDTDDRGRARDDDLHHRRQRVDAQRGAVTRMTSRRRGMSRTRASSSIEARDGASDVATHRAQRRKRASGGQEQEQHTVYPYEHETSSKVTAPARTTAWLGRHAFDVDARYEPIKTIGKGAYGVVCSAHDRASGKRVAIKKLANCFDSTIEARRALRELHLLRRLTHENVIGLVDVMMPANERGEMNDVYLVYELMDTDLHQIIKSKQELLDEHCQYFVYQILRGLKYVHSAKVLHRDLKPANLLLNANCDLKICDFGLARSAVERGRMMTAYVVTRWYRAPELLLNSEEYAAAIDMWSVGCVLAEILGRAPLFPGKDFIHQMRLIIETLGSPEEHDMNFMTSMYARRYIQSLPRKPKVDFAQLYPKANPLAIDLLDKMLVFNPERRINVDDALAHPYLASLHDPAMEPTHVHDPYDPFFNLKSFDEPDAHIPDEHLRQAIYHQFQAFKADHIAPPSAPAPSAPVPIPR